MDDKTCSNAGDDIMERMMVPYVCDVTNQTQVENMIQNIIQDWGGIDILVNNAGTAQQPKGPVDTLDAENLSSLLQLNVVAQHIVTSTVLRLNAIPSSGGHILQISSKAGKVGLENYSFYVASKFALEGLTSSWSKELKNRNIVVTSLSPGAINTQSFPKPSGKKGVRSVESIKDAVMMSLTAPMKYTGHYLHADELDLIRSKGLPDIKAWKSIDEIPIEDSS